MNITSSLAAELLGAAAIHVTMDILDIFKLLPILPNLYVKSQPNSDRVTSLDNIRRSLKIQVTSIF